MYCKKQTVVMAERIKAARKEKELSHLAFSELIEAETGVSIDRSSLVNYEVSNEFHSKYGSNIKMKLENLICIADTLGCSIDYLLGIDSLPDMQDSVFFRETGLSEPALKWLKNAVENKKDSELVLLNLLFVTGAIDHLLSGFAFYVLESNRTITVTDNIRGVPYKKDFSSSVERDISKFVAQENVGKALDLVRSAMDVVGRLEGADIAEEQ